MMGTKARLFTPVTALLLDELVLADHFYRHLDRVLDLSFVRDLVHDCYVADKSRPSIDPVVFFRLQLVMLFEGLRSERQLLRLAADRLSVRWYLGYNLNEPLPDHSTLTRIRLRYGVKVFRRFFEAIVEQCQQAGRGVTCRLQHALVAFAVGNAGRMLHHAEQEAFRIHQNVPFDAHQLLGAVKAAHAAHQGLDRLAIKNGRAGGRIAAGMQPRPLL